MTSGASHNSIVRVFQPSDEQAISDLFETVFRQPMIPVQRRWKYTGTYATTPPIQLAVDTKDRIIGHAGAIPLQGIYQGRPIPFFQVCDVMVHPDFRGHLGTANVFTRLLRTLLEQIAAQYPQAFAYGFPGRRPFLLGARERVYGQMERAQEIIRKRPERTFSIVRASELFWDDPRIDRIWSKHAMQYRLSLIRNRHYLRWRYAEHPVHRYRLLGLHCLGRLLGWAVVRSTAERLMVIDLVIARAWLQAALHALDRTAAADGLNLQLWLPRFWREQVNGEHQLTEAVTTHMIWRTRLTTEEAADALYYTMGDLDIF